MLLLQCDVHDAVHAAADCRMLTMLYVLLQTAGDSSGDRGPAAVPRLLQEGGQHAQGGHAEHADEGVYILTYNWFKHKISVLYAVQ